MKEDKEGSFSLRCGRKTPESSFSEIHIVARRYLKQDPRGGRPRKKPSLPDHLGIIIIQMKNTRLSDLSSREFTNPTINSLALGLQSIEKSSPACLFEMISQDAHVLGF